MWHIAYENTDSFEKGEFDWDNVDENILWHLFFKLNTALAEPFLSYSFMLIFVP